MILQMQLTYTLQTERRLVIVRERGRLVCRRRPNLAGGLNREVIGHPVLHRPEGQVGNRAVRLGVLQILKQRNPRQVLPNQNASAFRAAVVSIWLGTVLIKTRRRPPIIVRINHVRM
jgi:hypothetical protein